MLMHPLVNIFFEIIGVWTVLTDFTRYPEWNPFISYLHGKPEKDARIEVKMVPPNSKGMVFKPKVLTFQQGTEFTWIGHFVFPGLFDGKHIFELKRLSNDTTLFIQREKFYGILVPFLKNSLDRSTKSGFEAMNKAFKNISERNQIHQRPYSAF